MKTLKQAALATLLSLFAAQAAAAQAMTVYKTPWCGCCEDWTQAMTRAGYEVTTHDIEDLTMVKKQAGVSPEMEGCHTASLNLGTRTYVLEGHVPLQAIEKLTAEMPDIRGLATPGMPSGSLGMGNDEDARYDVYAFTGRQSDAPTVYYEAGRE